METCPNMGNFFTIKYRKSVDKVVTIYMLCNYLSRKISFDGVLFYKKKIVKKKNNL